MRAEVVPFRAEHTLGFEPYHRGERAVVNRMVDMVGKPGIDLVTITVQGEPMMLGACLELSQGRGVLWAVMSKDAGPHMHGITKRAREQISRWNHHRLEMDVPPYDTRGNRWARLLGFTQESIARKFYPDRGDAVIWAKVA